ncbi:glycosyltransferase family 2 protein [Roseomonas sp. PWR1]|uniref:Glycosyltransferase family 2 protein n=1 Tax=Roseomonas nitratireducens TaxID=2820810 RepID=A0ABS4ARI3_9PROT|nr:glycosyltransferase family 2 protein [Neoroseomonas nitratireducens]MBP0463965.1 glycosyltransferase family 2 protein [Neoroseomonas nitratireducens]
MRIAIGIATRGRAAILAAVLRDLERQSRRADRVIVCHVTAEDVAGCDAIPGIEFITAPAGLPRQRNAILDAAADCDVVLFLDDDFLCAPDYLAVTEAAFATRPDMVVATGTVVADGANGPGFSVEEGAALLAADIPPADRMAMAPHFNGYGCNMAFRMATVRAHGIRVDERLPLYAWYEDIDVTRQLGRHGAILRLAGARGVHLGSKSGRVAQVRLGYSQVVNPVYLARKGTFPWNHAIPSAARHCLANLVRSIRPEPWADRWGRFRGNMIGLWDLIRGKAAPERILEL